jgi:hypothetical protein
VKEIGFVRDYYSFESPEELQRFGEMVLVLIEIVDPPSGEISPEERERVLRRNIEQGLRMRLAAQGITGMSFIEANYVDPSRHPPREIVWTPRNHYVPSIPSTLTAITSAAERIFQRLEEVDVQKVVEDIDTLVITMTEAVEELNTGQLREEGSRLITDLGRTSAELRTAIHDADVPGLTASAEQTLEQATATLARVQRMVDGGRYDLELALENIRVASENLKDLTDTAREYPSLLLLGEPPERSQAVTR